MKSEVMSPFQSIDQVHRMLEALPNFRTAGLKAARFDLDHFRRFCKTIGDPQDKFISIHVGGTNGKGSTCQIIASIMQEAGYATGLYTSPHILRYSERVRFNGEEISDEALMEFFNEFYPKITEFGLSYFEISTALAFWWFAKQNVDVAVIEVGLGGRLDATNVITPAVSVITNVSLDHIDILGKTVAEIAREKAGIIKPRIPVVVGNISEDAREIVAVVARTCGSPLYGIDHLEPYYKDGKHNLVHHGKHIEIASGLETPVQMFNIAIAWQTVQILETTFSIERKYVLDGIKRVRDRYPSLGRFDRLLEGKQWYFDGGHNREAVKSMKQKVASIQPLNKTIVVLSLMRDKLNSGVINEFLDFKKIFYHSLNTERAATYEEVLTWLPEADLFPADPHSREVFFNEFKSELVIFAGSFYFYPTVRDWLASFTFNR